MTPELAVARAVQWQRDWHAWIGGAGSHDPVVSGGTLLGRAANVIEDLSLALTELTARTDRGPGVSVRPILGGADATALAMSRAAGDE